MGRQPLGFGLGRDDRRSRSGSRNDPRLGYRSIPKNLVSFVRYPLATVTLVYVGGVLFGWWIPAPLPALFVASFTLAVAALAFCRWRSTLLWFLLFLAGWTNIVWRTAILSPADLRAAVADQIELVTLEGELLETPGERVSLRNEQLSIRTVSRLRTWSLTRKGLSPQPVVGDVVVTTRGHLSTNYFVGQSVRIYGVLRRPLGPVAEGLFDYRAWLKSHGIYYQLQADGQNDWTLLASRSRPLADEFQRQAQAALSIRLPVEDQELRLLWAMTLGWKTALTDEVSAPFMRSGTMHIFAISGLHIALITGILVQFLRLFQVPRAFCGLLVIPLIWFYTAATGWQPSAVRSTVMMTVIIAGWTLKRPSDLLSSLAAAGFIILVMEPRQLFQASFQLSFFVVLSLALLLPVFERLFNKLWSTDPLLPAELRPGWRRWLDSPLRYINANIAVSVAAWLGSMPLIAWYFHLFTPLSLLANLVIVPLSGLALMCNLGSLLCGAWLPAITELFNHSAWFWMHAMWRLSNWFAALPGAYFYIRSPTIFELLGFYAVLALSVTGWLSQPKRWRVGWSLVVLMFMVWGLFWWERRNRVVFTVLPLEGGEAVFIDSPGRKDDLLVDCGNELMSQFVVTPFLRARGVNRLPKLLLTHGDLRSMGGVELIRDEFLVQEILTSSLQFRSPRYRQLIERLAKTPDLWRKLGHGDTVGPCTVLHPSAGDRFSRGDDGAVVLRAEKDNFRVLLLSDLGPLGQTTLLERVSELKADVLITGLPSQGDPALDILLDAVTPKLIVLCGPKYPAPGAAREKLLTRLSARGIPVIYTGNTDAVTLTLRRRGWQLRTMTGLRFTGS